ncbi:MAG: MinD/ParA family protein [Firmicutes bacterium]|jgi:flagellar biosynthesis protein FlhG|nr:MinD/ParA family protein [Bacillota bacterium]
MLDQAEVLRGMGSLPTEKPVRRAVSPAPGGTRVIAVTSGKGGVGKTNFVINLAVVLSDLGARVTILDADMGLANVDVILGISPRHNLHHVINGTLSLREIVVRGPRDVEIIPGGSGLREIADLDQSARQALISSLTDVVQGRDILVVDTGAGLSRNVMDFVLATREVVVITAPEPTAMADAYAMIKVISREKPDTTVRLVVNQCSSREEAQHVADQLSLLSNRFLSFNVDALGYLPIDPAVPKAVKQRQIFALAFPYCPASAAMLAIARRLRGIPKPPGEDPGLSTFVRRLLGVTEPDYLL